MTPPPGTLNVVQAPAASHALPNQEPLTIEHGDIKDLAADTICHAVGRLTTNNSGGRVRVLPRAGGREKLGEEPC